MSKANLIFSGPHSNKLWKKIWDVKKSDKCFDALYLLGCYCQELEDKVDRLENSLVYAQNRMRNLQPPPICFPQSEKATEDIEKEKFEKWAEWRWFPTRIDKDHFWQGWKAARGL